MSKDLTTGNLRDILFAEIQSVRSGESDRHRAQSVANLARQIIGAARTELEYWKMMHQIGLDVPVTIGQMALGSDRLNAGGAANIATEASSGTSANEPAN